MIPLYILILMVSSWLNGGYDKPVRIGRIVSGMGTGVLLLLAFYSLLDESQRYSRLLLLMGSAWTMAATLLIRVALSAKGVKGYTLRTHAREATLAVGTSTETARIRELYASMGISTDKLTETDDTDTRHLQDLIRIEHAEEVVFCGCDIRHVIELMAHLRTTGVEYRIAPRESDYVIGSETVLTPDDLYIASLDTISTDTARRTKRMFDIGTSFMLLLLSPVLIWLQKNKGKYFTHCLSVMVGSLTWVGYTGHCGVFTPADIMDGKPTEQLRERLTLRYMRHYNTATDFSILIRNLKNI